MQQSTWQIRVVCYSGYRGEETPRCFYLDKRLVEVAELIDRWLSPDHRYFKVRCESGDRYILRHDTRDDCWELTLFESAKNPPYDPG